MMGGGGAFERIPLKRSCFIYMVILYLLHKNPSNLRRNAKYSAVGAGLVFHSRDACQSLQ